MDCRGRFPFSLSRRFIENIGRPPPWPACVRHTSQLGRAGFREKLNINKASRIAGDKEHRRATDEAYGAISLQKLYGVPVGLIFFEGAPRLLTSDVTVAHLHEGDPQRIAVETYPGVPARHFIGRRSYKKATTERSRPPISSRQGVICCMPYARMRHRATVSASNHRTAYAMILAAIISTLFYAPSRPLGLSAATASAHPRRSTSWKDGSLTPTLQRFPRDDATSAPSLVLKPNIYAA